jgi:subtilisin family serine protease
MNSDFMLVSSAIDAIDLAIQVKEQGIANVQILASSWGFYHKSQAQALYDEIQAAGEHGMLFVAAVGNTSRNTDVYPVYPAAYAKDLSNEVSVAATDNRDRLAEISDYGKKTVDFAAPGADILSTMPINSEHPTGYAYMSGTSAASPHVAGIAALVLSVCPDLTPAELKQDLLDSVDVLPGLQGLTVTGGRINAYKAVLHCAGASSKRIQVSAK